MSLTSDPGQGGVSEEGAVEHNQGLEVGHRVYLGKWQKHHICHTLAPRYVQFHERFASTEGLEGAPPEFQAGPSEFNQAHQQNM